MGNFNAKHPELRAGEVFYNNVQRSEFKKISFRSKRRGRLAYNTSGDPLPKEEKIFPVFVSREEYCRKAERFMSQQRKGV